MIPTTDYSFFEQIDTELQRLYKRRRLIIEQIKAASIHDSSLISIEDMTDIGDGDSVPVDHMAEKLDGAASLDKVIMFWPLKERIETVREITNQIGLLKSQVDELMGIADVVRGASNPQDGQETNKIKERWAGIRLKRKQIAVQKQVRDLFRMMAELTVEHVTPENLSKMTQIDVTPDVYALLRDDLMRTFAIDVESDSTIAKDEMAERAARTEFMSGVNSFVQIMAPAVKQGMIPADLAREVMQIAAEPYKKYSRGLDDVLEEMPTSMKQLGDMSQQLEKMGQQMQQMQKQITDKDYALAQYSQSEEARQNKDTEGNYAKNMSTAEKNTSSIPGAQVDVGKTIAETRNEDADTKKKEAETIDILRPDPMELY
jgi:hypothetical protein